ncbi:long-chain-fatty-acid--CoA ligase [Saccharopolyspora karakumensis]|uniref:Long-chain-fatty-acid--CoA ligase n=1 Tax=Saccharopolyspora karakumensis TaxID=2530386 RepID=A0A4R5BT39_9PSEU|nr:long-chain fatty acid--CoA ligase [Saccharopolyspora karakumensis]TDD88440.1 long-chain-fatty-acid--CoA ligase [Saccharopolyspora karakumensis]
MSEHEGIGTWITRRALMTPGRTAVVFGERALTYAELADRVARLANRLRAVGVRPGSRVAYLGTNHPSFVETMFATHQLGAILVPLNFRLAPPEIAYMLEDSGSEVLVYGPGAREVVRSIADPPGVVVALEDPEGGELDYETWLNEGDTAPADVQVSGEEIALILYTSGTTGRPKGAMLSHANLVWNAYNLLVCVDITSEERTLVSAPLFHVAALDQCLLPTLLKGGCAVITPGWDVERAFDLIERRRITLLFGVTTMFAGMAASPRWAEADLSSVRTVMTGGAAVPETLIRTFQERGLVFCQGYGMTETAPGATFLEASESTRKVGSAGVPTMFTSVRVVRDDGSDTAPGEPGEVLIKGPNVSPGYWRKPEATAASRTDDGWFRSGDVAKLDDEGHLHVVDRVKDMFISGGENVYPAEVENAIFAHPSVIEVAVIGVPDPTWGEVGCAYVVCEPGGGLTWDELREFLTPGLANYKIPRELRVVDGLPKTGSGKVRKARLRSSRGA